MAQAQSMEIKMSWFKRWSGNKPTDGHERLYCVPSSLTRTVIIEYRQSKGKGKSSHTRLPSVVFRSWSRFLAVSLQLTWVINPAVGGHYFPPGLQLLSQFRCLMNRGTMGANSLPKTVTRQRRDCDLYPGPSAPESSTLTTRLPSHP